MMAPASTCTREGATPAIQGVGAEGLGRRGEGSFDGKAAAHESKPRCVRTAHAGSAHLHVSQHATSSLSKESHSSEPAGSKGGSGRLVPVAAGAAETAALAGETVAMAAVVAEAAGAADAALPQAVQAAVARAAAVVPAVVMAAAGWQRR